MRACALATGQRVLASAAYAVERETFRMRAECGDLGRADGAGPADVLFAGQHAAFGLAAAGGGDAFGLAFGAQLEFVFGGGGQDGEHEPAFLGVQVEVLGQRLDRDAAAAQLADGGQDVRGGAAPPVGLPEHEGVAGLQGLQGGGELGPGRTVLAGLFLGEQLVIAMGVQGVELELGVLVARGDPAVGDGAARRRPPWSVRECLPSRTP
jgi:hypothetical protein